MSQIIEYTTPGNYEWVAPFSGNIGVKMMGGGGGGGGSDGPTTKNGGGGGGGAYAYSASVAVVLGGTYQIVVGAGGAGGAIGLSGGGGGDSSFDATGVLAKGGVGGGCSNPYGAGGQGGSAIASVGTVRYLGGGGANGDAGGAGGGGGSSAGTSANGNAASGSTGGAAPTGGYAGGDGTASGAPTDASGYAAGGGGAGRGGGSSAAGADGSGGFVTLIIPNVAPNAPTLNSPTSGSNLAVDQSQLFTWTFSDPNTGDTQSAYTLRHREVETAPWTEISATSPTRSCTITAGTFAATKTYEWQLKTKDQAGLEGPYSSSSSFTGVATPGAPSITDPPNGSTVGPTYDVCWTAADQDAFQVRTVADDAGSPDPGTVYTDTGEVADADSRTAEATFAANGRTEHVQVRIKHSGLWSDWANVKITADWTPPATPTLTATADSANARIRLTWDNPEPEEAEPTVISMSLYRSDDDATYTRIATGLAPGGPYDDYEVASGVAYSYYVQALGDTGTTADSAVAT